MNLKLKLSFILLLGMMVSVPAVHAQKEQFNPIQTGVTSLGIAPDARGASLGDQGVSTDPDVNSQFWNPSKYAFSYSPAGLSLSYTPWLRKIVNDIFLANLSGYWKIGRDDNQAVSASLRYFSLGEVNSYGSGGGALQSLSPYEMSVDVGYSRKLSEKYSMGVAFRYIYSALGFNVSDAGNQALGASAFAADISGFYNTYPIVGRNECQWTLGWNLSNIGTKVSYEQGDNPAFLPTTLRLGSTFTFPLADYHNLGISLELNKLLVPTRPQESDYDMTTQEGRDEFSKAEREWIDMSPITGIFKSFSDAPGGFKEELHEINWSLGAEYNYNQQFFVRAGYYYEHPSKGNRQYFAAGAGFSLNVLRIDASYMMATAQTSPLDQTLRFTLSFDMDGLRELLGKRK